MNHATSRCTHSLHARRLAWAAAAAAATFAHAATPGKPHAQNSFGAPFAQLNPYNGERIVDNWELGGSAKTHRTFVRLTAEEQGKRGWMVNTVPLDATGGWSLSMELRASGASDFLFGDGLAIWLTDTIEFREGEVFGRADYWNGLGLFFDTFHNHDHNHAHRHPYIYVMPNNGSSHYVPDAEKDPGMQLLPNDEKMGCSYDFRYTSLREDVTALNHTRVHVTYRDKKLSLRLQQTSTKEVSSWFECFDAENIELPEKGYFALSAATGDLVDNHDVMHFSVRSLEGVADPAADDAEWTRLLAEGDRLRRSELDASQPEALQRDYARVIHSHANAIRMLEDEVELLKAQMEFQLAALSTGHKVTRRTIDEKSDQVRLLTQRVDNSEGLVKMNTIQEQLSEHMAEVSKVRGQVAIIGASVSRGLGGMNFYFLLLLIVALAGVGYNRYRKIMKSHLL